MARSVSTDSERAPSGDAVGAVRVGGALAVTQCAARSNASWKTSDAPVVPASSSSADA